MRGLFSRLWRIADVFMKLETEYTKMRRTWIDSTSSIFHTCSNSTETFRATEPRHASTSQAPSPSDCRCAERARSLARSKLWIRREASALQGCHFELDAHHMHAVVTNTGKFRPEEGARVCCIAYGVRTTRQVLHLEQIERLAADSLQNTQHGWLRIRRDDLAVPRCWVVCFSLNGSAKTLKRHPGVLFRSIASHGLW